MLVRGSRIGTGASLYVREEDLSYASQESFSIWFLLPQLIAHEKNKSYDISSSPTFSLGTRWIGQFQVDFFPLKCSVYNFLLF